MSKTHNERRGTDVQPKLEIIVITANAAGGARLSERQPEKLSQAFVMLRPDFIFLQELVQCRYEDQLVEDSLAELKNAGLSDYHTVFITTVEKKSHPCPPVVPGTDGRPGKWFSRRFAPNDDAAQGNGFLISPKWTLCQSVEESKIVSNFPSVFLGDRETEPRCLVMVQVKNKKTESEILLACTHLSLMRDEEKDPKKAEAASVVRQHQARNILSILDGKGDLPVILAGDFNAVAGTAEINLLVDAGFTRVTRLCQDRETRIGTHRRTGRFIDHILVRPPEKLRAVECGLLDAGLEDASDHRPVWAKIELR